MAQRIGTSTVLLESRPSVLSFAAIGGKKERQGPLGALFDATSDDTTFGKATWEKAEAQMQKLAMETALSKASIRPEAVDFVFAGDLLNQCISSSFGLMALGIPFLGQYGACSTMAQTIAAAGVFLESGAAGLCGAVTSSHFCSAERQYRFPLEYGGQRPPTAQWTVTGAGAVLMSEHKPEKPYLSAVTVGKITERGVCDANNMGAAMAPAAADTLAAFLRDTHSDPEQYDLIATGDLGLVGSRLLRELLRREGIELSGNYRDCGLLIYDREKQDVHSGGSGCGCSASVLCSLILPKLAKKELRNVLFLATGALMSPTSVQQGSAIPCIAHLCHFCA